MGCGGSRPIDTESPTGVRTAGVTKYETTPASGATWTPEEGAPYHRVTKIPIKPGSIGAIMAIAKTPAFTEHVQTFKGFLGVETMAVGDDFMVTHSKWESQAACEGGAAALGGVLKGYLKDFIAGPPEAPFVGPNAWHLKSSALGPKTACRLTVLPLKPGASTVAEVLEIAKAKEAEFKAIDGLVDITSFLTTDSKLIVAAGYESMEALDAAAAKVGEALKDMAPHFAGPPAPMQGTLEWSYPPADALALQPGCKAFNLSLKVPDGECEAVDAFFAAHKAFMDETHPTAGDAEPRPLMYVVTKMAEPKDPTDPSAGTTGNTLYVISETYKGMEGCMAHMAAGQASAEMFATFVEIVGKYCVSQQMMTDVIYTMKDPLIGALDKVKAGARAFNIAFKVPDGETAAVEAFLSSHKRFMDETHPTAGDAEPKILFYTVTKMAEPKDPNDPAAGSTGNTLYSLTEIYRGMEGCMAHMAAGQAKADMFAVFVEIVGKYAVSQQMMTEVVHVMG